MFTGIIESMGKVDSLRKENGNLHISIESDITPELSIDQSVSHNGVCLTVVSIDKSIYTVTAIEETLLKSNLGSLAPGSLVNLERASKIGDRLDGHIVQGHVDQTAVCTGITEANGSWYFKFSYDTSEGNITIEKGSVSVNGVSLTVVNSTEGEFSVAIIPYTYENTNFGILRTGDRVNIEFDVVGKYVQRIMNGYGGN